MTNNVPGRTVYNKRFLSTIQMVDISILATGLKFPEGPAFAPDGSLWAVEMKGESLIQYKDGYLKHYSVGGMPNGIAIDTEGMIWLCDAGQRSIRSFNPANQQIKTIVTHVDGEVLNKPNDLVFDSNGNVVFTCPGESRYEPTGYACVLMKDGTVKKITAGKYFPNGLAFAEGGTSLVIAETYKHRLWKGDWNAGKAEWTNEKVWCDVGGPDGPGGPDGMAFNSEGNLYVAVYGTGKIKVVNRGAELIKEIALPGQNPTNCAFDPSGKLGLVVTEAEKGELLSVRFIAK
jgi:gluconolactonase